jgi:hypothetical protein
MTTREAKAFRDEVLDYRMTHGYPEDIFEMRAYALHMIEWATKNIEGYGKKRQADKVPAQ